MKVFYHIKCRKFYNLIRADDSCLIKTILILLYIFCFLSVAGFLSEGFINSIFVFIVKCMLR